MAIARGAGTEILRCASFSDVDSTTTKLIIGVQHHIYTVLSLMAQCITLSGSEGAYLILNGYDSMEGTTNQHHYNCDIKVATVRETFVWNDKFSFNGFEPVDFSGSMGDATKQDAIADQGSGVAQYLRTSTDSSSTTYDMVITFLDQNNA